MDLLSGSDAVAGSASDGPGRISDERIALGTALRARAEEVGRMVDARFHDSLRGEALSAAQLATELIGRWLATDVVASSEDEDLLALQGAEALRNNVDLSNVAKGYYAWRDTTLMVLAEEAQRLQVSEELATTASSVIRLSCDGSLVRIVRQFDAARRALQEQLDAEKANLAFRALHDQLTSLPNRTLLVDRIGQAAKACERNGTGAMVLFLDLDNLKTVNDRFGHAAGDMLLVAVASRLEGLVRSADTVARLGGDEFVVLTVDLDDAPSAARSLAKRIHHSMRDPVVVGDREIYTSVSIGIAPVVAGSDPEVCLAQADAAMYQAKRDGPARFESYNAALGMANRRQSRLSDELRSAMTLGQLSLHYQPLFKVGGDIVGMEALLRWEHPELGNVEPGEFIPLLEQSREIVDIGQWVVEEASRQCRAWQLEGHSGLSMTVNVSSRQIQATDFLEVVGRALVEADLDPDALILDISEPALMFCVEHSFATMQGLRDLGVHIAIDDFGTGCSSLLYLRGLPIDRIKVDREFVHEVASSGHDPGVISTLVDLAHKLGLWVVAEGVETDQDLQKVGEMHCDEAQGFLLGRPGPAHSALLGSPVRPEG